MVMSISQKIKQKDLKPYDKEWKVLLLLGHDNKTL
jgi:hypothetical protein